MSNVVPFRRCTSCGASGSVIIVSRDLDVVARGVSCSACHAGHIAELATARPVFDAMIAAGVPRDLANDAMTVILSDERWRAARKASGA